MVDMAFSVETTNTFETLTKGEILIAIHKRLASLIENWEPEAFGFCDEYDIAEVTDE